MRSSAETPEAYLAELPEDRRQALARLRALILENLPDGYVEAMNWGMIAMKCRFRSRRRPITASR